jgi:hypothetical protein
VTPEIQAWIEQARAGRHGDDREEIVLFGGNAGVEVPFAVEADAPPQELDLARPRSRVDRDATDIDAAIRMAVSSFPEGLARRIVILSDLNENRGDVVAQARRAAAEGVEILLLPISYEQSREVAVLRVDTPSTAPPESVTTFTPILTSTEDEVPVRVHAFLDGEQVDSAEMVLAKGKSRGPDFRVFFETPGIHEVAVVVEAEGDTHPENNESRASVRVAGESWVLVVERGGPNAGELASSLRGAGVENVHEIGPGGLFSSPLLYQPFDAVVLSDVSALDVTDTQLEALEIAVRDLGVGLFCLGGEEAYAPGGYEGTALERALPVWMRVRQKQVMPNGALVLVLHTCEFSDGNYWAQEIAKASIGALGPRDYAGVIIFDWQGAGDRWFIPLQQVKNPRSMLKSLDNLVAGDMPAFDSSLTLAEEGLRDCPAYLKHIVVISDGDAGQLNPQLAANIAKQSITISTVCVAPHGPSDAQNMESLATWGKGRFYLLDQNQTASLPRIFIKEATTLRRNAIKRSEFTPEFTLAPEDLPAALKGFGGALPKLGAHTLTEAKDRAEVPIVSPDGDPVLAIWRYGLGESAAFTSAYQGNWLGDWSTWADLDRFLAQITKSLFRKAGRSGFHAKATAKGGVATVQVSAISRAGEEMDFLRFESYAVLPGGDRRNFPLTPKGAGVYEGEFPLEGEGTWTVVARYTVPGTEQVAQLEFPVTVSYPEEYAVLETNRPLIARLQSEAGVRVLTGTEDVFRGETDSGEAARSLASLLLVLAAFVLPFDVFVRRVRVEPAKLLRRLFPERSAEKKAKAKARAKEKKAAAPAAEVPDFTSTAPPPEPAGEAPPPKEKKPKKEKETPTTEESEHMGGLLEAKKRAKRKRRWEETGQ